MGEALAATVVAFPLEFFLLSLAMGVEMMSLIAAVAAGEAFIGTNGTVNNFFNALTEAVSTLEFFVSPFFLGTTSTDDDEDLGRVFVPGNGRAGIVGAGGMIPRSTTTWLASDGIT